MKLKIIHPDFLTNHAFMTKNIGGTNKYIEKNYNFQADSAIEIKKNHEIALQNFGSEFAKINFVYQIHSNKVINLREDLPFMNEPEADALVTNKKNIVLGIKTADCVPVLFADYENEVIGAAHAGRKGARNGILENTIKAMKDLGAKNISACIGPCIIQENYEIGPEIYDDFVTENKDNKRFFIDSQKQNHHMFDLPFYVTSKLEELNLSNIYNINHDTYSDKENFFSFRRYTHDKTEAYGSIISLITL